MAFSFRPRYVIVTGVQISTDGWTVGGPASCLFCSHSLDTSFLDSRYSPLCAVMSRVLLTAPRYGLLCLLARLVARSNNDSSAPDRLPHEAATKGGHQGLQHHQQPAPFIPTPGADGRRSGHHGLVFHVRVASGALYAAELLENKGEQPRSA